MEQKAQTLQQFLTANGVSSETAVEEIERLKAEYRRRYKQQWEAKNRAKGNKRINLRPSRTDYAELQKRADERQLSVAQYTLGAALAYGSSGYMMPVADDLGQLVYELNAIGRNINAVVKKMHSNRSYGEVVPYENLRAQFYKLDKLIIDYLTTPIRQLEGDDY